MSRDNTYHRFLISLTCILNSALFIYAAVSKILDFDNFVVQIAQSPMLTNFASIIAPLVITIELVISLGLLINIVRYVFIYASLGLMVTFTVYIVIIMNYSSFIPCSCGGILQNMGWYEHLFFNLFFILLSLLSIFLNTPPQHNYRRILYRVSTVVAISSGIPIALLIFSDTITTKDNGFTRRYIQQPFEHEKAHDLNYNSFYFAGFENGILYLGNYTAPFMLTAIDSSLTITKQSKVHPDRPKLKYHSFRLKVRDSLLYGFDGSVPVIFRSKLGDTFLKTISFNDTQFSGLEVYDSNHIIFTAQSRKLEQNILGSINLKDNNNVHLEYQLLKKQVDGIFDTDGMFTVDISNKELLYAYFYRNEILVIDKDLKLAKSINTIDTISRAHVEAAKMQSGQHKLKAPPLLVNKKMTAYGQVLMVESNLPGRYEPEGIWENASVIDIYQTEKQKYLGSIFIENRGDNKISEMLLTDGYLFVLSGNEILRYRLSQAITKHFKGVRRKT